VKLERTACYGSCPVYSVELEGDGRVTYRGQEHVKVKGAKSKTIPRASVDALAAKVESLGYFDLTWKDPCDRVATDSPTVTTTVTAKGRTRKIVDYRGDRCIPQGLRDFEDEIDRVLGMAEWTKCGTGPCTD
jgi:hypothetical protein